MPLDPTILDLDNLNKTINPTASTNNRSNFVLISLIVSAVIIASGLYLYNNKIYDTQTN